jgi:hypothetical protein
MSVAEFWTGKEWFSLPEFPRRKLHSCNKPLMRDGSPGASPLNEDFVTPQTT